MVAKKTPRTNRIKKSQNQAVKATEIQYKVCNWTKVTFKSKRDLHPRRQ